MSSESTTLTPSELKLQLLEEKLALAEADIIATKMAMDAGWMMISAVIVFVMNIGFALLESGSVRFKNY